MSAKKYLKMPQPAPQPAAKTEKEEQLWSSLKRHILNARERKKQELEAEVEEERQRKQREREEKERKEKDVMTLGETKDEIQALEKKLQELRNEKQQLFLQLKKVLNEDDRKRQQSKEQQAAVSSNSRYMTPPAPTFMTHNSHNPHQQRPVQNVQPHLMHKANQQQLQPPNPGKRSRSPSSSSPSSFDDSHNPAPYLLQKIEEGRRAGETRAVLWNKQPQYCQPGTLFYPSSNPPPPDSRPPQQMIYSNFRGSSMHGASIAMPMHPGYHVDMTQQKPEMMGRNPPPPSGSVYHINLNQPGMQQQQPPPQQMKQQPHPQSQQITIEKIQQIYNQEDVRKDIRVSHQNQQPHPHPPPHMTSDQIVYSTRPMHMNQMPTNQQITKSAGSITQGYIPARPPQNGPPPQFRHRY